MEKPNIEDIKLGVFQIRSAMFMCNYTTDNLDFAIWLKDFVNEAFSKGEVMEVPNFSEHGLAIKGLVQISPLHSSPSAQEQDTVLYIELGFPNEPTFFRNSGKSSIKRDPLEVFQEGVDRMFGDPLVSGISMELSRSEFSNRIREQDQKIRSLLEARTLSERTDPSTAARKTASL